MELDTDEVQMESLKMDSSSSDCSVTYVCDKDTVSPISLEEAPTENIKETEEKNYESTTNTSRYGRMRRVKNNTDFYPTEEAIKIYKSPKRENRNTPFKSIKMRSSKSPLKTMSPKENIKNNTTEPSTPLINHQSESTNDSSIITPKNMDNKIITVRKDLIFNTEDKSDIINCNGNGDISQGDNLDLSYVNVTNNTSYVESYSIINNEEIKYEIGDMAWARVGNHPFWPCLITNDPVSGEYVKQKHVSRSNVNIDVMHVTFFGDSGRRGWVSVHMLRPYKGIIEFEIEKERINSETEKKSSLKYAAAFTVSQNKLKKWNGSVEEAERVMRMSIDERLQYFPSLYPKTDENERTNSTPKSNYKKTRKSLNMSLSESLYDSLFSEGESKDECSSRSINVSDVVTACLDDIATKTGNKKIQKQSHMDRWLLKAKTPQTDKSCKAKKNVKEIGDIHKNVVRNLTLDLNESNELDKENVCDTSEVKVESIENPDSSSIEVDVNESQASGLAVTSSYLEVSKCSPDSSSNLNSIDNAANEMTETVVNEMKHEKCEQIDEITSTIDHIDVNKKDCADHKGEDSSESSEYDFEDQIPRTKIFKGETENPEFKKYLSLHIDKLEDENPHLTQKDLILYLFKTWQYSQKYKTDDVKNDEIQDSNMIKGLDNETKPKPKKERKRYKAEKPKRDDNCEIPASNKPSRKRTVKSYVLESDSDADLEVEYKGKVEKRREASVVIEKLDETQLEGLTEMKNDDEITNTFNEFDFYMEQLKKPKPNLFKGLPKEKVCEVCEKSLNLVKCKCCSGMFHQECSKQRSEEPENTSKRGRRKKKKVGRPKKMSENDSESDDEAKSNDSHNEIEAMVVDEIDFENKIQEKISELIPSNDFNYDSYESSDDDIGWDKTVPGKCEIVDIKLKKRCVNDDFVCSNCEKLGKPTCFVCKSTESPKGKCDTTQRCSVNHCNMHYHLECLEAWPQTQFNSGAPSRTNRNVSEHFETLTCPRHVCHTCVCDDPRGCKTRFSGDKLARCIRCPAVYHSFTQCLPAGTEILTASQVICPRHYDNKTRVAQHMNTSWCFICALGGSLICCDSCPTSFHATCLNISPPEGGYICEDCETGRFPLYGEIVWVKLGVYRWWPAVLLHPVDIPENVKHLKHHWGEFVVRFFGANDHYWVHRGRVFPYQEGDKGSISTRKSTVDHTFELAMEQAEKAFKIIKQIKMSTVEQDLESSLRPPHYVKLKVNKPTANVLANYRRQDNEDSSMTQCECSENDPCGPDSHCLNRMLLTECGPNCVTGELCKNRAFEKRLYPKLTPYRTPWGGWGLKTLEDIKQGQFVVEYVGELIDEVEFKRRMKRKHETKDENYYFLTLDKDRMIDAGPKGNVARFMNNSCDPNCETQKWTVLGDIRVGLFALKDIPANSEVTFNYNLECATVEKKRCLCGASCCSGYIGAKPKQIEAKRKTEKRKYVKKLQKTQKSKEKKPKEPPKSKDMIDIENDLMIIQNASNGFESDHSCSDIDHKRKRLSCEDNILKCDYDDSLTDDLKMNFNDSLTKRGRGRPRKYPKIED